MRCIVFTLTFDSSPIKGEGDWMVGVVLFTRATLPPLWIADQVRNDGAWWLVLSCFTLCSRVRHWDRLFDSSSIKGEGIYGWFGSVLPALWFDESLMNLLEILGL